MKILMQGIMAGRRFLPASPKREHGNVSISLVSGEGWRRDFPLVSAGCGLARCVERIAGQGRFLNVTSGDT